MTAPTKLTPDEMADIVHDLKTWPEYFDAVASGAKTFEVRLNDRGYMVGNILRLRRFDPRPGIYTGEVLDRRVSYVLRGGDWGIAKKFVVLGLAALRSAPTPPARVSEEDIARAIARYQITLNNDTWHPKGHYSDESLKRMEDVSWHHFRGQARAVRAVVYPDPARQNLTKLQQLFEEDWRLRQWVDPTGELTGEALAVAAIRRQADQIDRDLRWANEVAIPGLDRLAELDPQYAETLRGRIKDIPDPGRPDDGKTEGGAS